MPNSAPTKILSVLSFTLFVLVTFGNVFARSSSILRGLFGVIVRWLILLWVSYLHS